MTSTGCHVTEAYFVTPTHPKVSTWSSESQQGELTAVFYQERSFSMTSFSHPVKKKSEFCFTQGTNCFTPNKPFGFCLFLYILFSVSPDRTFSNVTMKITHMQHFLYINYLQWQGRICPRQRHKSNIMRSMSSTVPYEIDYLWMPHFGSSWMKKPNVHLSSHL